MMRSSVLCVFLLGACAAVQPEPPAPVSTAHAALPTHVTAIGGSPFVTILDAPPSPPDPPVLMPVPASGSPFPTREAAKAQHALMGEFEQVRQQLRSREANNYTDARIIPGDDWAFVFYFKHDPAATLARYTANPHFQAAQARYSAAELESLARPWIDRLQAHGILGGYGTDATLGTADLMVAATEEEFAALADANGWEQPPGPVRLGFAEALKAPKIDPAVASMVRAFEVEAHATTIQLEALGRGKLVMRDGCPILLGKDGKDMLAFFHRETGIGLDPEGYLATIDRHTGKASGRFGEDFVWAAPNAIAPGEPGIATLKAACGDLPIINVGNPESAARFNARHHL